LVILVVGRDAGVLDDRLFGMMVVMAIVTTLMTSPILAKVYPQRILRMEQNAAANLDNLRGFHVLAAADSARLLIRLGRIGGVLCGQDRPASVSLCSLAPISESEIGTGISTQYLHLAERSEMIERLETELAAAGISTGYSPLSGAFPLENLAEQAELQEPSLVLVDSTDFAWFNDLATTTKLPLAVVSGPPPVRREPRRDEGPQRVRVELSGDTPLAVELGCRLCTILDAELEIVDSTGGQRRRVSSYRSRVQAAGVQVVQPGTADGDPVEPIAVVRDAAATLAPSERRPQTVFTVRGEADDQGDLLTMWLDRQRGRGPEASTGEVAVTEV
jgi:hypothetical protein